MPLNQAQVIRKILQHSTKALLNGMLLNQPGYIFKTLAKLLINRPPLSHNLRLRKHLKQRLLSILNIQLDRLDVTLVYLLLDKLVLR